jgi:hypothetical protein
VRLSRLWQPRRGLFWVMVAFNGLSSLGAWALRVLPLQGAVFAVVALLSLMNCAGGLWAAWRLVADPPAAGRRPALAGRGGDDRVCRLTGARRE